MMKCAIRSVTAASMFALGVGAASAADLAPEPYVEAPPPVFNWTGFYAGVHAGYAWGGQDDNQSNLFEDPVPADSFDVDGFLGGVHGGYNWQVDQMVFGIEGDIDYTNIKGSEGYAGYVPNFGYDYVEGSLELKSNWQASLRLRAGYAVDNFLLYATGGVAFADGKMTSSGYNYDDGAGYSSDDSNTHVGWTIGIGAEYAFTPNWIARAEVRYTDFGSKTYDLLEGPVDSSWDQTAVTVGLSYKF
jgi:outer membrane immunogenic protein